MSKGCLEEIFDLASVREAEKILVIENSDRNFIEKLKKLGHVVSVLEDFNKFELNKQLGSYDLVLSCGQFGKLGNDTIRGIFEKILKVLKNEGKYAFCESCFLKKDGIVSQITKPATYAALLRSVQERKEEEELVEGKGREQKRAVDSCYSFELLHSKLLSDPLKVYWLAAKRQSTSVQGFNSFQEFLDSKQYSEEGVLKYEKIFGEGFISTGGIESTKDFLSLLRLEKGERVLDVGAGIGGGDFLMTQHHGVVVHGIDLSANVIGIAWERQLKQNIPNVNLEVCDVTTWKYPPACYDVIYSRDTILHIKDKKQLFERFYQWLKPGGRLLISDYCSAPKPWSSQYEEYVAQRGYHLLTVEEYGELLEKTGFAGVVAENKSVQFVDILKKELERITNNKQQFLQEFSEKDYKSLVDGWNDKLKRCSQGDQQWGLFRAKKL